MRIGFRRTLVGASLLAVAAASAVPAQAAPAAAPTPLKLGGASDTPAKERHVVTLLTGEQVTVERGPDGRDQASLTAPGDESVNVVRVNDETYVLPFRAMPLIAAGRVDRELFNVTKLVDYGYDDTGRGSIPVIATYRSGSGSGASASAAAGARTASAPAVPAGAKGARALRSINGVAFGVDKKSSETFWDAVTPATGTTLENGFDTLMLDGQVKATLDQSVPLIGAPQVWNSGHDGKGVKVAILDTGVDTGHPDLAGRIDQAVSFVPGEDVQDGHGHGTHVASTIAGTGAASGGKYKGVAPGATLEIGKVLNNSGSGDESSIIAGMEWAAHNADIVSMSLGGCCSGGLDPLSLAVNRLTAETGTLFVIAAGNDGRAGAQTIGSPGAAAAALTVGATSKQDVLADFSSRGPLVDTFAVKPDLTAPGVAITAARADGTALGPVVDERYTTISGTSMATPHVAGAAALLVQQHPDWRAEQIKGALLSSTKELAADQKPTEVGTGRLDVARASTQDVYATPGNLDLGMLTYPRGSDPVTKPVTYTNDTDAPVTFALTAPAGFHLGSDSVTIPAHGNASVEVNVIPAELAYGSHNGYLTATDGTTTIRTIVGTYAEDERYPVNLKVTSRDGTPAKYGTAVLINGATGEGAFVLFDGSPQLTVRLRPGRYDVLTTNATTRETPEGIEEVGTTLMANHDLVVTKATDAVFDNRTAGKVSLRTPQPADNALTVLSYNRLFQVGDQLLSAGGMDSFATGTDLLWVAEAAPPSSGKVQLNTRWLTYEPLIRARTLGTDIDLTPRTIGDERSISPTAGRASPRWSGKRTTTVVDVGTAGDLAGRHLDGAVALVHATPGVSYEDQVRAVAQAGAGYVLLWRDASGEFPARVGTDLPIPTYVLPHEQATALAGAATRGTVRVELTGRSAPTYGYDIMEPGPVMPNGVAVTVRQSELAAIETTVNSHEPGHSVGDMRLGFVSGVGYIPSFGVTMGWPAGVHRVDYVRARPGYQYLEQATPVFEANTTNTPSWQYETTQVGMPLSPRPGEHYTERWNEPVLRPGLPAGSPGPDAGFPGAYRRGDMMTLNVPGWNDGGGHHGLSTDYYGGAAVKIYRDGELFATGGLIVGNLPVAPERATYTITRDAVRTHSPYSGENHTTWTFTSSHVDGDTAAALPLPQLDYHVDTDAYGRAAKKRHTLEVTLRQPDGVTIPVTDAHLSVSYDDGKTWTTAGLVRTDTGEYHVQLSPPAGASYVSLKADGADRDGNTIEQTIIHAYGLI